MEDNIKSISTDLFYKVRSRFSGLKLGNETGEVTINPEEAVFFDFDYMEGENPLGHVSISLAEPGNMKVYYSTGITEEMDNVQKDNWYGFLRGLREFAKRRLMSFDTRDITKDNLDKRDFSFLSQYTTNTSAGEGVMKESMYGTAKTSYQKLENTKLIIKHSQQVDETSPGARTRHIQAMFIENGQGERFKYPFIHLAGARAMQRHVQEGGLPYDEIGKYIIGLSEKIAHLKNFGNYVVRNDLMNSETNEIVSKTTETLNSLREEIKRLSKRSHYEQFKAEFQGEQATEVPSEFIEDLTNKFTVKNFKEDIKAAFPIIYNLMQAKEEINYDDIVAMTQESINDEVELVTEDDFENPFDKFENWAMNLGEESAIQSSNPDEKAQAIEELQKLVGEHFPAGVDGQNAIQSLRGLIDDPQLAAEIKAASKEDADTCVRPLVYKWLEANAPEVVSELDFGDMETQEGNKFTGAMAQAKEKGDDDFEVDGKRFDIKEVAEFMYSCYDRESRTFPKGPEGVVTMVGKKFGEQAEQVARKFVERMAPQQTTENNPELQELARIRELSGLKSSEAVTQEAAGGYVWDEIGDDQDKKQLNSMAQRVVKMYQHSGEVEASEDEILATLDEIVRKYMPKVGTMNNVAHISQEFFDKFPLKKSEPEYDDDGEEIEDEEGESRRDDFHRSIWGMVKIAHDAEKGDTGSYGYKVHPRKEDATSKLGEADEEGVEDLLAAVEEEINNPGGSIDNLRDVMNATIDADQSPEFEKARAVINKYLDLVDNAGVDHPSDDPDDEEPAIRAMKDGDIKKHIRDYDLTDYLAHAAAMLDKIAAPQESIELERIKQLSGIAKGLGF